jgi:hypothetical protein
MDAVGVLLIVFGAVTVLYAAGWVFVLLGKRSLHTRKGPAEPAPLIQRTIDRSAISRRPGCGRGLSG